MKQIAVSQGDTRRVEKLRQRLYSRMPLIGGWRGLRASQALARDGSPEALAVLEEAASHSDDGREGAASLEALRKLAEQGHTGAQESLCRLVIEYAHAGALETAVAAHYAPRDEHQRALFLFLSEQWDSYDSLDFDHSLLEAVYMAADESLRRRVADKARQHGRVEWIGAAVGGRKSRRLGEMGEMEWEAVVAVL
ncbi:MAG: hypothetical protein O2821_04165 [Chloroflexi bacterium]|nr:hypothetical protein [Chloroflexota bacterium]MDA1227026.1 hypothetical protein [Chloroflexota bacterium]